MGDPCLCSYCDRDIKSNQTSIECSICDCWVHKACTGLSKVEYNKICALHRKTKTHNWKCKNCQRNDNKRLSSGRTDKCLKSPVTSNYVHSESLNGSGSDSRDTLEDAISMEMGKKEVLVKDQIANLLKKTHVSNGDVLSVFSGVVDLLLDQRKEFQTTLNEIKESQRSKNERIDFLEDKVSDLEREFLLIRSKIHVHSSTGSGQDGLNPGQCDVFGEMQERSSRVRNVIVFNINECQSNVTNERVDHDKDRVLNVLDKLEIHPAPEFKVVRIGRPGVRPRPIKVIFLESSIATLCLKNGHKLRSSNIQIRRDLTQLQRNTIKGLYEELDGRKRKGEANIAIRYRNGNPFIAKILIQNEVQQQDVENFPKNG